MSDKQLFVTMVLNSWQSQVRSLDTILGKLSDEQLQQEVSPTRNRGIYILGHLTAVHDLMLPLLRFGDSIFPELQAVFVDAPDKSIKEVPSAAQLRSQWSEVNLNLSNHFHDLPIDDWFTRHANASDEDFEKEPQRNRLNVLSGRVIHMSYHRGQLILLSKKK
jgi:uncharacterized damage-inducible protein DinB